MNKLEQIKKFLQAQNYTHRSSPYITWHTPTISVSNIGYKITLTRNDDHGGSICDSTSFIHCKFLCYKINIEELHEHCFIGINNEYRTGELNYFHIYRDMLYKINKKYGGTFYVLLVMGSAKTLLIGENSYLSLDSIIATSTNKIDQQIFTSTITDDAPLNQGVIFNYTNVSYFTMPQYPSVLPSLDDIKNERHLYLKDNTVYGI